MSEIVAKYNYWIYVVLMMIGFYAMIGKRNLVKKLLGMNIFQTAIILFFVSIGVKNGGWHPHRRQVSGPRDGVDAATVVNPLAARPDADGHRCRGKCHRRGIGRSDPYP